MIDGDRQRNLRRAIVAAKAIRKSAVDSRKSAVVIVPVQPTASPTTPVALSAVEITIDDRCCRICLDDEGEMYSPCACRGTQALVHKECLDEWRSRFTVDDFRFHHCLECREQYKDTACDPMEVPEMIPQEFTAFTLIAFLVNVLFLFYLSMNIGGQMIKFAIIYMNSLALVCVRPLRRRKVPLCTDTSVSIGIVCTAMIGYGMESSSVMVIGAAITSIPILTIRLLVS